MSFYIIIISENFIRILINTYPQAYDSEDLNFIREVLEMLKSEFDYILKFAAIWYNFFHNQFFKVNPTLRTAMLVRKYGVWSLNSNPK